MRAPTGRVVAAGLLTILLAGCADNPPPTAPVGPPTSTVSPPTSFRLPARPTELPLDGIDPCQLITPAQRDSLGIVQYGTRDDESDALGSPACAWLSATRRSAENRLIRLVTRQAADYYLDNTNPVQVITVGGLAAVQTTSPIRPSDQDHCLVLVDVAAGQTLWTQYSAPQTDNPGITQQTSCSRARTFAEAALTTLRGLRPPG